jgi:UDP-N-acetylglucosamine acyltransferase
MTIHNTAVVDSSAQLDSTVEIGPYAVIGANVTIGAGTKVEAHAVVSGPSTIGERNLIGSFATVGGAPQDLNYKGEPTELIIGSDNQIREYASIHRGTPNGKATTVIGDNVVMANVATLAGHVEVGERAAIGGLVAVHQFCRIGAFSYIGGVSGLGLDVPPYVIVAGIRDRTRVSGINKVGLRRNGFSRETINNLDSVFRIIYRSPNLLLKDALQLARTEYPDCVEVQHMIDFFESSKRGVVRRTEESI